MNYNEKDLINFAQYCSLREIKDFSSKTFNELNIKNWKSHTEKWKKIYSSKEYKEQQERVKNESLERLRKHQQKDK